MLAGAISDCGCMNTYHRKIGSTHHGMKYTRIYSIWQALKNRCNNTQFIEYNNYGGRGITYDKAWKKFENFRDDMYESYQEHVDKFGEKNTSIDRIDVNGNYCKENCRWATLKEQANNKTNNFIIEYNGETHTLTQWARKLGISRKTIYDKLSKGWNIEEVLS